MKLLRPPQRSLWHFNTLILFLIDLALLFGCVLAAFQLSPSNPYHWSIIPSNSPLYLQAIFLPIFMAFGLLLSDAQRLQARFKRTETLVRVFIGSGIGSLLFTLLHALINFRVVGRYIILISWSLGVILTFGARLVLWKLTKMRSRAVLFWGDEEIMRSCTSALNSANLPIDIIGRYAEGALHLAHVKRPDSPPESSLERSPERSPREPHDDSGALKLTEVKLTEVKLTEVKLTETKLIESLLNPSIQQLKRQLTPPTFEYARAFKLDQLYDVYVTSRVESLVLSRPDTLTLEEKRALTALISCGVRVQTVNHFFESELERVHVESVQESWLWDHELMTPYYRGVKRFIDLTLSLIGLLCLAPIAPLIALLIWSQDRGPILYTQERVGLYGVPFKIYKFRTMRINAERTGAQWAQENDQRITYLGRILRKTRLDETPQFFNILRGEMSFVGPRPEREELMSEIELELPSFRFRNLAKPGLSGWAQINYGYGSNVEEARIKLSYDLYYLKHASVALDLLIVLRTFSAMMRGAR